MPTKTIRTARITFQTPTIGPKTFEALREQVHTYDDGQTYSREARPVRREVDAVAASALPGGPFTVSTFGELFDVLSVATAAFEAEDVSALAKEAELAAIRAADAAKERADQALEAARIAKDEATKAAAKGKAHP